VLGRLTGDRDRDWQCDHSDRAWDRCRDIADGAAHREGDDIAQGGPAPIASEALERIATLYAIEKTIRGRSDGDRRAVRQQKSRPLVLAFKAWLEQQLARVSADASTTVASSLTPISSKEACAQLFSIEKMRCSRATIRGRRTGPALLRSSKPAN